jgi:formamidopyrimidine-DNA glycosylase
VPELPDVEGFRRELAGPLPGCRVRHVKVHDPGILRNTNADGLKGHLAGRRFDAPRRRGKWLILPTEGPTLLVHTGMTGHPHYAASGSEPENYERLAVSLDRGELRYADLRKLRGV